MPRSPWKSIGTLETDRDYLALASSIPTTKVTSAWRMFRGASRVRKQLARTPGVIGFSLLAQPFRNRYATLSVWTDADALAAFVAQRPHSEVMNDLKADMATTRFEQWTISGADGRPTWDEARQRLDL